MKQFQDNLTFVFSNDGSLSAETSAGCFPFIKNVQLAFSQENRNL